MNTWVFHSQVEIGRILGIPCADVISDRDKRMEIDIYLQDIVLFSVALRAKFYMTSSDSTQFVSFIYIAIKKGFISVTKLSVMYLIYDRFF